VQPIWRRLESDPRRLSAPTAAVPGVAFRRVRVGTMNPPKLEAVRRALTAYQPAVSVEGVAVDSGVPEQPVGFEEIVRGARNRARAAAASGDCDLAVGIEDGLVRLAEVQGAPVLNVGCAIVSDGEREGLGTSSGFSYPPECVEAATTRRDPIGDVFDRYWRIHHPRDAEQTAEPSALSGGNVGKLSLGVLERSEYARHAVLCALVPFLHPSMYREPAALAPAVGASR